MTSRPEPGDEAAVEAIADDEPAVDELLVGAHDLARAALLEITSEQSIGEPVGYSLEDDGVVSLRFATRLAGYPGWFWTVSVARVGDAEPTVLEAELLPGDEALLAPEWVPWAVRLADYHAQQRALSAAAGALDDEAAAVDVAEEDVDDELEDLDDDDDELEDLDDDEDDDLEAVGFGGDGSAILHAGDVDGVDIDELADDDEFDREDDMSGNGLDDVPDEGLVSDEDDLGEDELQDDEDEDSPGEYSGDAVDDEGDFTTGERLGP